MTIEASNEASRNRQFERLGLLSSAGLLAVSSAPEQSAPRVGLAGWRSDATPISRANRGLLAAAQESLPLLPMPTPATDDTVAQSSELYGDQYAWVQGDQQTTINGDKTTTVTGDQTTTINGHQQTNAGNQTTNVKNSLEFAISNEDITWAFKFAMNLGLGINLQPGLTLNLRGMTASVTVAKVDFTIFSLHKSPAKHEDRPDEPEQSRPHDLRMSFAAAHALLALLPDRVRRGGSQPLRCAPSSEGERAP